MFRLVLTPLPNSLTKLACNCTLKNKIWNQRYQAIMQNLIHRSYTSATGESNVGLFDDIPINPEYFNYKRYTASQAAKETVPPKSSLMLVRDFIDDCLYNPNYGYFSKQAVIFSPEKDFEFNKIKDNLEFTNLVAKKYRQFEETLDETNEISRQVWHTPTELFKPWYGYAIAKYLVNEYKLGESPQQDLIIYELGAGNGTLMLNILDYIQKFEPSVYKRTKYRIVEISEKLANRQLQSQKLRESKNTHDCVEIINRSIFEWNELVSDQCFFLACEVLDNFAHDLIRYDTITEDPLQAIVITDDKGEYDELYEPVTDELILRYLQLRSKTTYKSPALQNRLVRQLRNKLPLAPNMSQPEFIPTKVLLFLEILKEYFPKHRLIISDFYKLPNTIKGIDAPVVQTRYKRMMIPCSTFMLSPGWFDIFFPTNFELLRDIYQLVCKSSQSDGKIGIFTQKEFLKRYADLKRTKTKSGEIPLLMYYENVKFLLS
ncbi:1914_t:CDS:2 [Acaulospora morrowiae]|uniref:Protein arginine methyltransferase NDUFAF7 n=1 Tax=Acaulospora morrowiae TaxID=94023 RepID=A0A9N9CEC0_9GLOM|nr:1914_t:CDS:2 [Acaulospora morrowiae]